MKKILEVTKVAFNGQTGDDRAPESLAFPACMTSLMETVGEGGEVVTIGAHGRKYIKRLDNDRFLASSGMAFGLLWEKSLCKSAMDLMQVAEHGETIRRAFAWAGREYKTIESGVDGRAMYKAVRDSIDRGAPVLAFGLFEPPECAIIAGYDDEGETVIGWSHFQDWAQLEREENGMFRKSGWQKDVWTLVLPGEKCGRSITHLEAIDYGISVMQCTRTDGYLAGQAAYDEWARRIETADELDEAGREALYDYHHNILFNLAELRCWGANFLREAGCREAAGRFQNIHDKCWRIDALAGGLGARALEDAEKRAGIAEGIRELQEHDKEAAKLMREFLSREEGKDL